mgnify:CR=1 FL=1
MKKDYAKTADTLIAALGGKDNITRLFHLSLIHISEPTRRS